MRNLFQLVNSIDRSGGFGSCQCCYGGLQWSQTGALNSQYFLSNHLYGIDITVAANYRYFVITKLN